MQRQELALCEKVLGADHPHTLTRVYCLASLLANQHHRDEASLWYERACVGYKNVRGEDHPTPRACRQRYFDMTVSQGQGHSTISPQTLGHSPSMHTSKRLAARDLHGD